MPAEAKLAIDLQCEGNDGGYPAAGYRRFRERLMARASAMHAAGVGLWFAAFVGARPVGRLRPGARLAGLDASNRWARIRPSAGSASVARSCTRSAASPSTSCGLQTLVMCADPHDVAIGIYRSLGFEPVSGHRQLQRRAPEDRASSGPLWPGLLLAGAGAVAFSGKAIIVKLRYRYGVDALTLIMYRMLFALPLFVALSWWASRGRPALQRRDWKAVFGLGFSGYYLASTLDFAGLQFISASLERLILYLTPTLVLLLGAWWFHRSVSMRQLAALAVSYAGVLVVFGQELSFEGESIALGAVLVFASTLSYAVYLVASGEVVQRIGSLRLTGLATTVACLLCIVQFLVLRPASAAMVAPEVIWLSLLNAVACTFAPVLMVMMAIERIGAGLAAQTGMIGPMATIAMGVMILGEPFTPWLAAGTVLVLVGVWLLAKWR